MSYNTTKSWIVMESLSILLYKLLCYVMSVCVRVWCVCVWECDIVICSVCPIKIAHYFIMIFFFFFSSPSCCYSMNVSFIIMTFYICESSNKLQSNKLQVPQSFLLNYTSLFLLSHFVCSFFLLYFFKHPNTKEKYSFCL